MQLWSAWRQGIGLEKPMGYTTVTILLNIIQPVHLRTILWKCMSHWTQIISMPLFSPLPQIQSDRTQLQQSRIRNWSHPSTSDMYLWALFWPFLFNYLSVFIWFHSRDLSLFAFFWGGSGKRVHGIFFFFFNSEGFISVRKISTTSNLLFLICSLSLLISLCLCFNKSSYEHNPVPSIGFIISGKFLEK